MGQIQVEKNVGGIEGLCVITPAVHGDARGYFVETYNQNDMKEAGLDDGVRAGQSVHAPRRVCCAACISRNSSRRASLCVPSAVPSMMWLSISAPTARPIGKWYGIELTEENHKQFYIPQGFAHGFLVLSDIAEFCYKCTDFYHPGDEGGMAWNDPEIGITWPQLAGTYQGSASAEGYTLSDGTPLNLSDKDQKWVGLKDTFHF